MGLKISSLRTIKNCFPVESVLSLGYPDLVVPRETLNSLFNIDVKTTHDRGAWHGVNYRLPDTQEFFSQIGAEFHCIDIHASRGIEEIRDLNFPQDLGQYDLVIDGGTVEHCFNIGQAIINAASAVKPGGYIYHGTPMSCINHGFYNVSPTLYADFYDQNGWEIKRFYALTHDQKTIDVPKTKRFVAPPELHMICLAKRINDNALAFPMQEKYRRNPDLQAKKTSVG